ncbi:MAG: SDR family oxidoreductase [Sphingobacteriales bacterium]|nr:MAG: SDR family oxidoreductase [Sphingobacteriales bacterium]
MQIKFKIDEKTIHNFASAICDQSSIHINAEFARKSRYRKQVGHGILPLAGLIYCLKITEANRLLKLKNISANFKKPYFINDVLTFSLNETFAKDILFGTFRIYNETSREEICVGKFEIQISIGVDQFLTSNSDYIDSGLTEATLEIDDLSIGHQEQLRLQPSSKNLNNFLGELFPNCVEFFEDAKPNSLIQDESFLSIFSFSSMIGMKLPGRNATFLSFELNFNANHPTALPSLLSAEIVTISKATSRIGLSFQLHCDDRLLAEGKASTLVNSSPLASISSRTIQQEHLSLGVKEKVVLVTGASRGIGEATAKLFAMHGAWVAVHYFKGEKEARSIVDDIRANGGRAYPVQCDIADYAKTKTMFEEIEENLGSVEILINNAVSEFIPKKYDELTLQDYISEFQVSLFGVHHCCQLAIANMKLRRAGKIINLGSVVTELPTGGQMKYATAKSALIGFTRSLASELAEYNIQVNLLLPNMTETSLLAGIPSSLITKIREERASGSLLQPIDVAKFILFLASSWADPMSGQRLIINQGEFPFI